MCFNILLTYQFSMETFETFQLGDIYIISIDLTQNAFSQSEAERTAGKRLWRISNTRSFCFYFFLLFLNIVLITSPCCKWINYNLFAFRGIGVGA